MRYRRMGSTGLRLSEISIGTWATVGESLDLRASTELLTAAYDEGVNLFDTAEVYAAGAAESLLGDILAAQGWNRETFVVCSKIMWGVGDRRPNTWGLSRKHVIEGCEASLRRLRLSHLDLLLCHRPDAETPLEETVGAIGALIRAGKVLYWGTSEWPPELITAASDLAARSDAPRPVVDQSRYNLFERSRVEQDLTPLISQGLGVCGWSPLAYGVLAGRCGPEAIATSRLGRPGMEWLKRDALGDGRADQRLAIAASLSNLADESGVHVASLALAWCLGNSAISSVITGASSSAQLRTNLQGLARLGPVDEVRELIEARLRAHNLLIPTDQPPQFASATVS